MVKALGREPTDITIVCCDDQGNRLLFVGLPGASYRKFAYNAKPKGSARVSNELATLYGRLNQAIEGAVRKGGEAVREDDSAGYALIGDAVARSLQLELRRYALEHESEVLLALETSSNAQHRRIAAEALGYARQSHDQILALVRAARDPDGEVRNNAVRALGVLARSNASLAASISPDVFIEMLSSGVWSDRNKAVSVLDPLAANRDPELLSKLRAHALDPLMEMALWQRPSHSYSARMLLGRIAGLPEERLRELAWKGPVDAIIKAVRKNSETEPRE
jgi:hypothetical protein